MLLLSGICFVGSLALTLDGVFLAGTLYHMLPAFSATAAAALGLGLAALLYRRRKGNKQREWPMVWMLLNAFAAVGAAGFWAYGLIRLAAG